MSLPIVLAIGDADKDQIGGNPDVALQGPDGGVVAILRRYVRPAPPFLICVCVCVSFSVLKCLFRFEVVWFDQTQKSQHSCAVLTAIFVRISVGGWWKLFS